MKIGGADAANHEEYINMARITLNCNKDSTIKIRPLPEEVLLGPPPSNLWRHVKEVERKLGGISEGVGVS